MHGLYAIVDLPHARGLDPVAVTGAVLGERRRGGRRGAAAVQLRGKHQPTATIVQWLQAMGPMCGAAGVPLIVNDDIEAACAGIEGVTGVHLGQGDCGFDDVATIRTQARRAGIESFTVGISTHDLTQLRAACRQRPDYLAYGPVCQTPSKRRPDPVVGLRGLLEACQIATRPVVAIGGLDERWGRAAIEQGASAVAMIGALIDHSVEAIESRAMRLADAFEDAARPLTLPEVRKRIPVLSEEQLVDLARWSDALGIHVTLGLPARFRPSVEQGEVRYRPWDVLDLLYVLDKQPEETWEQWARRDRPSHALADLVQLRSPR